MSVRIDESTRYYDLPAEEEELSQSRIHHFVIDTLESVINQMYKGQNVKTLSSVNIYYPEQPAVAPDVAVIDKLLIMQRDESSYYIDDKNPVPRIAIEVASNETWGRDLKEKLVRYERMQIPEYFVFDPNEPRVWDKEWRVKGRLVGWFFDVNTGKLAPLPIESLNRMWSKQLNSWLVVTPIDELFTLRLYEQDGTLRPSVEEARDAEKRRAELERRRANKEQHQAEMERKRADEEKQRAEIERSRAEAEKLRADEEKQRAEIERSRAEAEKHQAETERKRADEEKLRADAAEAELARLRRLLEQPNN